MLKTSVSWANPSEQQKKVFMELVLQVIMQLRFTRVQCLMEHLLDIQQQAGSIFIISFLELLFLA